MITLFYPGTPLPGLVFLSDQPVGSDGDIWVYLQSLERTGILRYSSRGREKAFYSLETEFDPG